MTLASAIASGMGYSSSGFPLEVLISCAAVLFVFILIITILIMLLKRKSRVRRGNMAKEMVLREGEVDISHIVPINRQTVKDKLRAYRNKPWSFVLFILIAIATVLAIGAVLLVLIFTLIQGIPNFSADLFAWEWTSSNLSMMPALINTLVIAILSLLIAGILGVFAAIFMVEYAKSTNIFVKIVRVAAETLAGIPSIVYGIFGMIFFVLLFGWGYTLLGGAITMAMMIMPLIMRTTEERTQSRARVLSAKVRLRSARASCAPSSVSSSPRRCRASYRALS